MSIDCLSVILYVTAMNGNGNYTPLRVYHNGMGRKGQFRYWTDTQTHRRFFFAFITWKFIFWYYQNGRSEIFHHFHIRTLTRYTAQWSYFLLFLDVLIYLIYDYIVNVWMNKYLKVIANIYSLNCSALIASLEITMNWWLLRFWVW